MGLQTRITSVTLNIVANILAMVALILFLSHFIGCIWFYISYSWSGDDRWLTDSNMENTPWYYQYLTALHWSITQFTPASMGVFPRNSVERAFTITVVMFGL